MRARYPLFMIFAASLGGALYACGGDDDAEVGEDAGSDVTADIRVDTTTSDSGGDADGGEDAPRDGALDSGASHDADADAWDGDAADADADASVDASPMSVMLLRVGDFDGGSISTTLGGAFIDEYTVTDGGLVRTIALPMTKSGDQYPLILVRIDRSQLARSDDGHYLSLAGYGGILDSGVDPFFTQSSVIPRVVARVSADGSVDTSTLLGSAFDSDQVLGATSSDGEGFWTTSGFTRRTKIYYVPFGSGRDGGTGDPVAINSDNQFRSALSVINGQLYAAGLAIGQSGIYTIGTGLPTGGDAGSQAIIDLAGASASAFVFLDMDATPGFDRLYCTVYGKLQKWSLNGDAGAWTQEAVFASAGMSAVTAYKDGANAVILGTDLDGKKVLKIVDDGTDPDPFPTTLITLNADTFPVFRGIALPPVP